jgi:hypothetical protein
MKPRCLTNSKQASSLPNTVAGALVPSFVGSVGLIKRELISETPNK